MTSAVAQRLTFGRVACGASSYGLGGWLMLMLFLIMLALAALPSTSVVLVAIRASASGFRHGAAVGAGIVAGDLFFVLLAVLGMTALAELLGAFFVVLRYVAAAYLVWFGVSLLRAANTRTDSFSFSSGMSLKADFMSGLLVTLGDIKAIFFYASLFPVFLDMHALSLAGIGAIIVITIIAVGGIKLLYAWLAARMQRLPFSQRFARPARTVAGSAMIGAGAWLLLKPHG